MSLFGYILVKSDDYDEMLTTINKNAKLFHDGMQESRKVKKRNIELVSEVCDYEDSIGSLTDTVADLEAKLKARPELHDVEDVLTEMRRRHPDKMLLDEGFTDFQRGREVGYIELIEEIEALIKPELEDEDYDN